MPSSNGVYSLPPGYLATTGQTILVSQHNVPFEDVAAALTARVMRDGSAPMTGPLKLADGTAAGPALAFASATGTGLHKSANGIGFDVLGSFVAEIGPNGFILGDKTVALRNLYHPSGPSLLLGSDSNAALTITGAANNGSGLIRLAVAATATFTTGQTKTVSDVLGTTEANGTWVITVVDPTHIDLQGSSFVNGYLSGGTIGGGVEEITIGSGLSLGGAVLTSAFAPPAAFKNLSIKVLTNTTVAVAADFIVTTDGTSFKTTALSGTINLGTNGAANALDTGTIAIDTWYAIWAIAKPDGTTAGLASTSGTAPAMPSGYTLKARIGWVRTIHASATLLGTWQFGRRAQYVVGLAQTADLVALGTGNNSAAWQTLSVSTAVPSTASEISLTLNGQGNGGGGTQYAAVAPNNSYSTTVNGTPSPPIRMGITAPYVLFSDVSATIALESTNVYLISSTMSGATLSCSGWIDNI
jgi:hypothetical protein